MVPIVDIHKLFDLIIDKIASPYLESDEKDKFINMGIRAYVQEFFNPIPNHAHMAERRDVDIELISELIEPATVDTSATGEVPHSSINAALPVGRKFMYILNVAKAGTNDCKDVFKMSRFCRHNEFFAWQRNEFKKPTEEYPVHRFFNERVKFDPEGVSKATFTVVMEPRVVTLDDPTNSGLPGVGAIDCELSIKSLNRIVLLSLNSAGISIRDSEFYQMINNEKPSNE